MFKLRTTFAAAHETVSDAIAPGGGVSERPMPFGFHASATAASPAERSSASCCRSPEARPPLVASRWLPRYRSAGQLLSLAAAFAVRGTGCGSRPSRLHRHRPARSKKPVKMAERGFIYPRRQYPCAHRNRRWRRRLEPGPRRRSTMTMRDRRQRMMAAVTFHVAPGSIARSVRPTTFARKRGGFMMDIQIAAAAAPGGDRGSALHDPPRPRYRAAAARRSSAANAATAFHCSTLASAPDDCRGRFARGARQRLRCRLHRSTRSRSSVAAPRPTPRARKMLQRARRFHLDFGRRQSRLRRRRRPFRMTRSPIAALGLSSSSRSTPTISPAWRARCAAAALPDRRRRGHSFPGRY